MSRHRRWPGRLQAHRDHGAVSPWLLSLISATCHRAAPMARDVAASTMGLSIALPPESGNGGTCPLLSLQPRRAALAYTYIFMPVSPFNCIASPLAHFPAIFTNGMSSAPFSPGVPHGHLCIHSTAAANNINRSQGRHSHWLCVCLRKNVWMAMRKMREK